jgi:cysteine desulfurase
MLFLKRRRIYADAAAATPLSPRARRELIRLLRFYGNAGALHSEAVAAKKELEGARASVAQSIGAHPDEIIFTASGTEGNNLAIQGAIRPLLHKYGPLHAITCTIEHQSVLEPLRALKRDGLELTELAVDNEGRISIDNLRKAITEKTVFISIQLVNSEVGTIQPLHEIAKEIRRSRASQTLPLYLHTDASQAPLWMDVKVATLGVDLLTLDAQKIMGPKGVGALYVKRGVVLEPILSGSKQEGGLRGGTENVPLIGTFAVALADAQKDSLACAKKTAAVRDFLWKEIKKNIPDAALNGPQFEHRVANNINLSIPGLDREMAVLGLNALGVAATTRSACNVVDSAPSHVIQALGVSNDLVKNAIRITLLPDAKNTQARRIAQALATVAKRYRNVVE